MSAEGVTITYCPEREEQAAADGRMPFAWLVLAGQMRCYAGTLHDALGVALGEAGDTGADIRIELAGSFFDRKGGRNG